MNQLPYPLDYMHKFNVHKWLGLNVADDDLHSIARMYGVRLSELKKVERQLQDNVLRLAARLGGYASSIGRPLVFGKPADELRRFIQTGLEAHRLVIASLKAAVQANRIDALYREFLRGRNAEQLILYGPGHGTGLMEGEHPWIEKSSDFLLEENMTFCVDNFLRTDDYGQRWEDVVRVTAEGAEEFTNRFQELLVL